MADQRTREFLESRLNYEARGMPGLVELRVDRTALLLDRLGNPHHRLRVVHVAGTKGKGSTSTIIASLVAESGRRVGLHTSPHLLQVEERFRINGIPIDSDQFSQMIDEMRPVIDEVDQILSPRQPELTFFEITTALALLYFERERVDLAVIEVGMGGRLDSTNVVDPLVSVITSISLDHTRQLGDTIAEIAFEKAGIIKTGKPVVSTVLADEAMPVIDRRAEETESAIYRLGKEFHAEGRSKGLRGMEVRVRTWKRDWPALTVRAIGEHQIRNTAGALATIDLLESQGDINWHADLGTSLGTLRIPGRFEIFRRRPLVVLEVAHNPASFQGLATTLRSVLPKEHRGRRILLFAASRDKDWRSMLSHIAGVFSQVILTSYPSGARALPGEEMLWSARDIAPDIDVIEPAMDAWKAILKEANAEGTKLDRPLGDVGPEMIGEDEDLICVAGSFYLVAELLRRDVASAVV
jgi:dihydrofolate synthase/folylpolyglutamate synthase